jgi:hypothetical protein
LQEKYYISDTMIDQHVHPDFTADFSFEIDKGGVKSL